MEQRHATQILALPGGRFAGRCSCGHMLPAVTDRRLAAEQINQHVYEAYQPRLAIETPKKS